MRYWVIRTDRRAARDILGPELREGRLRQGWGYLPEQDLRLVSARLEAGGTLSGDQAAAWAHAWRLLPDRAGSVQQRDRLLLPNLPREGVWSIAEAEAGYEFSIDGRSGDHGHIRSVRLLHEEIEPRARGVSARLRRTMRCQRALWNVDGHGAAVEQLLVQLADDKEPAGESEPLIRAYDAALEAFWKRVQDAYGGAELERPIQELLGGFFDEVESRAGRGERGADFLCRHVGPLGERHTTAVQVKMWDGLAVDRRALDQLREAARFWPGVTSCALLTTAEDVDSAFERARAALEDELGKPVHVICPR